MGKRTTARRLAMQALYQLDMGQDTAEIALEAVFSNEEFIDETKVFAEQLVSDIMENRDKIDDIISKRSIGWSIERISAIDRNILRIALYELLFTQTPKSVVINEAVNIAKKFGADESSRFINGILGKFIEDKG